MGGLLTSLKHNSGSTLEALLWGSNRGKEFLVGAMDVRVADQVVVKSPVNDGLCSLFSSCQGEKDGRLHGYPWDPEQDRDSVHLVCCLLRAQGG